MQVSPAKHSYVWLPRKCDYRTDRLCAAMLRRRHNKGKGHKIIFFFAIVTDRQENQNDRIPKNAFVLCEKLLSVTTNKVIKCDYWTDTQTERSRTKWSLPLCFAGNTKTWDAPKFHSCSKKIILCATTRYMYDGWQQNHRVPHMTIFSLFLPWTGPSLSSLDNWSRSSLVVMVTLFPLRSGEPMAESLL